MALRPEEFRIRQPAILEHVAQKYAAVLGQRHATKQALKARRLNPFAPDPL
jgi:hypothetical protein